MTKVYIHGYDLVAGNAATVEAAAQAGDNGSSFEQVLPVAGKPLPLYPLSAAVTAELCGWIDTHRGKRYLAAADRLAQLGAFAARRLAVPSSFGAVAGSSRGVSQGLQDSLGRFHQGEPLSPRVSPTTTGSAFAAALGQVYQLGGMTTAISAACSSGLHALGVATSLLRSGAMPGALVSAAEACLDPFTIAALRAAKVHSERPGYRPFSAERSGLALAEGAAAVTLSPEPPPGQGFELAGFASCRENATMTGISSDAKGLQQAIRACLDQAQVGPGDIDLIVSHGAGTPKGDAAELSAYRALFLGQGSADPSEGAKMPPLQHYKWLLGHSLGATGLQALVLALHCTARGLFISSPYPIFAAPTHTNSANVPIRQQPSGVPRLLLVCSLGFGGICSAVVVRRHGD